MTETFTASNGARIEIHESRIDIKCTGDSGEQHFLSTKETEAAREFFKHEADEQLGRWRWPENPDYVIYAKKESDSEPRTGVRVVHEATGRSRDIGRDVVEACEATVSTFGRAARAYFEDHPERKPWEGANPGEVWLLTLEGVESAFYPSKSLDRHFTPVAPNTGTTAVPMNWPEITAGRRIWPEDAS